MTGFVVGLRGGIGTGKSTVSDLFAARGIVVADADVSARTIVEPGKPAFKAIVEHFGEQILQADGTLNRAALRERIFSDENERKLLESITQRRIIEDMFEIVSAAASPYCILVLSTGLGKTPMMQRLLVVDAPADLQIKRVMTRDNNTRAQVEAIMAVQPSREVRIADADDLIINDGDMVRLKLEVDRLHELYLSLATDKITAESHG